MINNRCAYDVPEWLQLLKPGNYTVNEIVAITGAERPNISMRFAALSVEKKKELVDGHWRNVYKWRGAAYYWKKAYEEKKKSLHK